MLITRRVDFSASHVCARPDLSPEQNRELYGEEANLHGHGHNFVLEVALEGPADPRTGMVFDLKELKRILNDEIVARFDHRFLNREVPPFDSVIPTPENIAAEIWRRLEPKLNQGGTRLHTVRLYETEDLWVEYSGEQA